MTAELVDQSLPGNLPQPRVKGQVPLLQIFGESSLLMIPQKNRKAEAPGPLIPGGASTSYYAENTCAAKLFFGNWRTKNNFHVSGGRVRAQRWPGG